jgi:hypothetical protein
MLTDTHALVRHGDVGHIAGLAVVEEAERRTLSRWDERVSHHEVVASALCGRGQLAAWRYAAKMPRGRVIDTTQLGRSTVSLIFRSPATLHRA